LSHKVAAINITTETNATHVRLGISSSSDSNRGVTTLAQMTISNIAVVAIATTW